MKYFNLSIQRKTLLWGSIRNIHTSHEIHFQTMPKLSIWQVMKYYIIFIRTFMGFQAIDKTYAENLPYVKEVVRKRLPYSLKI